MSSSGISEQLSLRELVFSDLARHRADAKPSWLKVFARCLTVPGMIASLILRSQQVLHRSGHVRLAAMLRTVAVVLVSADFGPGMQIGTGLLLAHPVGVNIGYGVRIGNDVVVGYEALILSGVTIGDGAIVASRAVVTKDVEPYSIVAGNPARLVKYRFDEATRAALLRISWWDWPAEEVARLRHEIDSPDVAGFIDRHDPSRG